MSETKLLEEFPCLKNDFSTFDLRVCVLPNGHEGEHCFVDGSELFVSLDDDGAHFTLEESAVN